MCTQAVGNVAPVLETSGLLRACSAFSVSYFPLFTIPVNRENRTAVVLLMNSIVRSRSGSKVVH